MPNIFKSFIFLIMARGLGLALGLGLSILLANRLGAGSASDAFFLARRLVMVVVDAMRTVTTAVYIPSILENRKSLTGAQFNKLLNRHILKVFSVTLLCTLLCIIAAPLLTTLLAPGFDAATQELTSTLLQILLLTIPLGLILALLTSLLNSYGSFATPELVNQAPRALLVITLFFFVPPHGTTLLATTMVIGAIFTLVIIAKPAVKLLKSTPDLVAEKNPTSKKFETQGLFIPVLLMQGYGILVVWIDYAFASATSQGGVSILEYGQRLIQMVPGVIAASIITIMYTKFAQQINHETMEDVQISFTKTLRKGLLILIPITLFMCISSDIIINLVLNHGAFTDEAATTTAGVMSLYAPSTIFSFMTNLALAVLYIDKSAPRIKITIVMIGVGLPSRVLMDYYFSQQWGVYGISLAATLSNALVILFIYPMLRSYWGKLITKRDLLELMKIMAISITMLLTLWLSKPHLTNITMDGISGLIIQFGLLALIGLVTFIASALLYQSSDSLLLLNKLLNKVKKRVH